MAEDLIRYDVLTQDALRDVVRKVIAEIAQTGLPGDHHFFITFHTRHPGVSISSRLAAQHPDEMTVVMQHQFWDLHVTDTAFEIGLSFNGVPEHLVVPFKAISAFVDPHVNFGLKFNAVPAEEESVEAAIEQPESDTADEREGHESGEAKDTAPLPQEEASLADDTAEAGATGDSADVVSLDAFRKKNG